MKSSRTAMKVLAALAAVAVALGMVGWLRIRESDPPRKIELSSPTPLPANRAVRTGVSSVGNVSPVSLIRRPNPEGLLAMTHSTADLRLAGASWYFNWTYVPDPFNRLEFVPLICGYPGSQPISADYLATADRFVRAHLPRYPDRMMWVVGNEIGFKPQRDGRTPDQYAVDFHRCTEMLRAINPSFQFAVAPAILSQDARVTGQFVGGNGALPYLRAMLEAYRQRYGSPIPSAYFAATAHVLENDGVSIDAFRNQVVRFRRFLADEGYADRGVIITEYGAALRGPNYPEIAAFMQQSTAFLAMATDPIVGCPADGRHLVQRWAWFTAKPVSVPVKVLLLGLGALTFDLSQTSLFDKHDRFTYLGNIYAELNGANR